MSFGFFDGTKEDGLLWNSLFELFFFISYVSCLPFPCISSTSSSGVFKGSWQQVMASLLLRLSWQETESMSPQFSNQLSTLFLSVWPAGCSIIESCNISDPVSVSPGCGLWILSRVLGFWRLAGLPSNKRFKIYFHLRPGHSVPVIIWLRDCYFSKPKQLNSCWLFNAT